MVTGINFVEQAGPADITVDDKSSGAFANVFVSNGTIVSATINVSSTWIGGVVRPDTYAFQTFVHEIGHALGLGDAAVLVAERGAAESEDRDFEAGPAEGTSLQGGSRGIQGADLTCRNHEALR